MPTRARGPAGRWTPEVRSGEKITVVHHDLETALDGVLGEAVRSSPLIVLGITPEGTIRFANDTVTAQLGHPLDDWVGHNVLEFVHPDDVERALLSTATLTTGMSLAEGVTRFSIRHADGTFGHRVVCHDQSVRLRDLLAAGHDDRDGACSGHPVEVLAIISLHNVCAHLRAHS